MKLSEMNQKQLLKAAVKYGVKVTKKMDEADIRDAVAKAVKAKRFGGWPAEWSTEQRATYYRHIVGTVMPDNAEAAWHNLVAAIEKKAVEAKPIKTPAGPDCFGILYTSGSTTCDKKCPVAPLCKKIHETRPDFAKLLEETEEIAEETSGVDAQEALSAKKPKAKPASTKKTAKAEKPEGKKPSRVYQWVGDIADYKEAIEDEDLLKVYVWASKQKNGFTLSELAQQLGVSFDDEKELAKEVIKSILAERDLKIAG